ncbi:DUF4198 domain-containing protein [Allomuricauda sp. SCSIO 65647]|uniref:DUF4198 domain-containing protein n=1 Tax=Allomuricauda sp. SCSIO 65647 TaxID=2908843 RepID=UPI001F351A71|nr:DUF4198 domain-containing protein [Muricauda sp. SCSIO 65647]UJH69069.1 DUF4198 domain-containing protein [Muricauda sp. SCSIO 65647]
MKRTAITVLLLALFFTLSSHELFLKSDTYFLEENSRSELYLFNGTFDESENVITRDRIIDPQIIGPEYNFKPSPDDYYDKDKATYLQFKTGFAGTYVAGVSTKPRTIELSGEEFTAYLEHEGLTAVIEDRKSKGISDQMAREKYSKHVKAIFQVDEKRTEHFSTSLGYPIEFIPLKNPYILSVGDSMSFKLLYRGEPLGNQTVHISSRKNFGEKGEGETAVRTNDNGEVSFTIGNEGQWYIATIHMIESDEGSLDYESNWATLTFEVK